jgi:CRISPR-associated protein Cas2
VSLTVIVARDVEKRYHGRLRSIMLEVSTGVYISTRLNKDTRERVWSQLSQWHGALGRGSLVMVWQDRSALDRTGARHLGEPPRDLVEIDGLLLTRRPPVST